MAKKGNVLINGRTAVHAGSKGILTTVDVCWTKIGQNRQHRFYQRQSRLPPELYFFEEHRRRTRRPQRNSQRHHNPKSRIHFRLFQRLYRRHPCRAAG